MQKDNIEYVKQLIREEGGYVSCVDPMGPFTIIFATCHDEIYEIVGGTTTIRPSPAYERVAMEHALWQVDDADEMRKNIRDILQDSDGIMAPIFSVYAVHRPKNSKLNIRMGFINHLYGKTTVETTIEEAEELIKNPPNHVHPIHIEDLKTVYKL